MYEVWWCQKRHMGTLATAVPVLTLFVAYLQCENGRRLPVFLYKGLGIYDVKVSVPVFFWKLHHRGERGRKGRECKISKQSTQNLWHHKFLDPCIFLKSLHWSALIFFWGLLLLSIFGSRAVCPVDCLICQHFTALIFFLGTFASL